MEEEKLSHYQKYKETIKACSARNYNKNPEKMKAYMKLKREKEKVYLKKYNELMELINK